METTSPDGGATDSGERNRKRRRIEDCPPPSRWRTLNEQQIYSSKLLDALRHVRRSSPASPPRSRAVREAADRVLAIAARGRTRWSRAILLSSRRTLSLKVTRRRPRKPPAPPAVAPPPPSSVSRNKAMPALERKAKVLGRLIPGCRKLPFPALLDETSDYIAALQMQVRAMTAIAEILSSVGVSAAFTSSAPPPPPDPLGPAQPR